MLENILNIVIGASLNLYDRFGRWFVLAVGSLAVLLISLLLYFFGLLGHRGGVDLAEAQRRVDEQAHKEAVEDDEHDRKNAEAMAKKKAELAEAAAKRAAQAAAAAAAKPVEPVRTIAPLPAPKPARPERLADWKKADYLSACREGDPRLSEAIDHFSIRFKGSESAARLLVELLQTPGGNAAKAVVPGRRDTTTAIIDALVANGSAIAREGLVGLLAGSIKVTNDREIVTAVLRALARGAKTADDDLLLAALVEMPPRVNTVSPATGGGGPLSATPNGASAVMSAAELHSAAAAAFRPSASENLRLRLAKRILEPGVPPADRPRLIECLNEPRPDNLAAQVLLFANTELEPRVLETFQRWFMECSMSALASLQGIRVEHGETWGGGPGYPRSGSAGGVDFAGGGESRSPWGSMVPVPAAASGTSGLAASALRLPEVDPALVGRAIWTQPFCAAIEQRLAETRSLSDSHGLVLLAATVPLPAARTALQRALERHWYEGPAAVFGTGLPQGFLPDPGLLFVLKSLPHRNQAAPAPSKVRATAARPTKSAAKTMPLRVAQQKQDQVAVEWVKASERLIEAMTRRFQAAARARKFDRRNLADAAAGAALNLPREAEVVGVFAADLPGAALAAAHSPVEPLRVRYVMANQKTRISAVAALCRRQVENCQQRTMPDGVWLDGYQGHTGDSRRVSVDVLIHKLVPNAPFTADQEQDLLIEVLSLEKVADAANPDPDQDAPDLAEGR